MAQERYILNVEAVIVDGDRYLMILRGAHEAHAAGTLGFPGGKVEPDAPADGVLEATARRETREEVGLEVGDLTYLRSTAFTADDGDPVVNVVFLGRYRGGTPAAAAAEEVAAVKWMTAAEVLADPAAPPWTRATVLAAEGRRPPGQRAADGEAGARGDTGSPAPGMDAVDEPPRPAPRGR